MLKLRQHRQDKSMLSSLSLFEGEEHRSFTWPGSRPAALLLHGFLGTPAEVRPLASELNQVGWSVQGLLLPGFGAEIDNLFTRHSEEWTAAARDAIWELQAQHWPVMVVGYSMGAAVALNVAAETSLDGLVLIAPFWKIGTASYQIIWQVLKRLIPQLQPFKKADFNDPRFRDFFAKTMPDLDVMEPGVQQTLRDLRVPSQFIDQVLNVGQSAGQVAAQVSVPVHIIQGVDDEIVKVEHTRELLPRLAGRVSYEELAADHGLVSYDNPGFQQMSQSVIQYAHRLVMQDTQQSGVTQGY